MQRLPLVPSTIEAGQSHPYYDDSPPRTPTHVKRVAKGKGRGGASRAVRSRSALRETFLTVAEDHVRGTEDGRRDSHDLSLSPRHVTRDSVVTNMLLSLDQFSTSRIPISRYANGGRSRSQASIDGDDIHSARLRLNSADKGRRRGHTHSSSLSFEPDLRADGASSRSTSHVSRSRRSNSSTTFHSAPRRLEYLHREDETTQHRANLTADQRATGLAEGDTIVASWADGKGSKSSASSSLDMSQGAGGSRRPRLINRRSSSTDQSYGGRGTYLSPSTRTAAMVSSHSEPLLYDDYEAAPTPIVPVGLRRDSSSSSAVYPPQPPPASSRAPLPRLQNDSEPLRSRSAGWTVPESDDTGDAQGKRQDYESMRTTLQELPALPAFFDPPALGTAVSTEKPFAPSIQSAAPSMRDRPGFFRRVFGSSRSHPGTLSDSRRPSSSFPEPLPLQTGLGADNRSAQGSQIPPHSHVKRQQVRGGISVPPTKDPTKDTSQAHLNRKPSSFFRRRKKSSCDQHPLPTFPSQLPFAANDNVLDQPMDPSPVSSLRKVMNPYLHDNLVPHSDGTHGEGMSDYDAAFLAGYTARNESSVKLFKEASAGRNITSPLRKSPDASATRFPKLDFNPPTHDDSFLQDSSSNEGKNLPRTSHLQLDLAKESTRKSKNNRETPKSAGRQPPPKGKGKTHVASPIATDRAGPREVNPGMTAKHSSPPSPKAAKSKQPAKGPPNGAEPKEWITTAHLTSGRNKTSSRIPPSKSDRVWLEPTSSDEDVYMSTNLSLPLEGPPHSIGASESSVSDYKSASSRLPTSPFKPSLEVPALLIEAEHVEVKPRTDATEPTEQERQQAKKLYDGDEDGVAKDKAAAWLGESGADHARVLRAYMELFEWRNLNILASLRDLCGRLLLKGETQQVDRILDAFSIRWVSCNANHGFKATDVVHTICYSILLLNTDLHSAEIEQKMTRAQFIRNTMPTVRRVASEAAPNELDTLRAAPSNEIADAYLHPSAPKLPTLPVELQQGRASNDGQRPNYRLVTRPSDNSDNEALSNQPPTHLDYDTPLDDSGPLVKAPFHGKLTTWEVQVEIVLKDFYNSIRQQRLPLYGSDVAERGPEAAPSMTSLSVITGNMLRRTPSVLSKTGSEHFRSRGRASENRPATGRWAVKPRSRPRLYPASTLGSSRTSLDDDSIWSPSISSSWSKYSFGKTQTSMSVDSLGSSFQQGDYQQSIGFANALSQAIIREEAAGGSVADDNVRVAPLLEDESLGLAGAPWAKEGILKHKHHLESVDKKAKDRSWTECFAVIEQGWMRLFSFHMNAKSMRQKAKNQKASGGVVGGGNWTESAEALGKFQLRQTIASALPPPGYSKIRPHVWALSLPNGAVHLFQVGTPEIVKEFVTTANYWSARLSKEPFVGGISNVEYGWGNSIINAALLQNENRPPSAANVGGPRLSLQSSIRSSLDQGSVRAKLPGDKVVINDWLPPQQSMAASALLEVDQLNGLLTYVKNVEEDLQTHNELRGAMLLAFSPRHPNSVKAMANWERKSAYLLREIVKFRTYIDCLQAAQAAKEHIYAGRAGGVGGVEGAGSGRVEGGGEGGAEGGAEGISTSEGVSSLE